eukprot:692032-Amphidinium_carterae.2
MLLAPPPMGAGALNPQKVRKDLPLPMLESRPLESDIPSGRCDLMVAALAAYANRGIPTSENKEEIRSSASRVL